MGYVRSLGLSESGQLLEHWHSKTVEMYKNALDLPNLLVRIPEKSSLCVSRLLGCYLTTDTCNTAKLLPSLLTARIIDIAKERGGKERLDSLPWNVS